MKRKAIIAVIGCILCLAGQASGRAEEVSFADGLVKIAEEAWPAVADIEKRKSALDRELREAIKKNDTATAAALQEEKRGLATKDKDLRSAAVARFMDLVGNGIVVPVSQQGMGSYFSLGSLVLVKADWYPGRRPHATLRITALMRGRLPNYRVMFLCVFKDREGNTLLRLPCYFDPKLIGKNTPGKTIRIQANANIETLKGAVKGEIVDNR